MPYKKCQDCFRIFRARHICVAKTMPGIPETLKTPKGYPALKLTEVLNGLRGNRSLSYNAGNDADRMTRAMKPAKGIVQKTKRRHLRIALQQRFGKIDWK